MAHKTLSSMARGGIQDQIGGGFSRYSTDDMWLAPHFEKMLYDNGLLALAYLEGFRLTRNPYYRRIANAILAYVARELTDEGGGFYCGQDADSQGVEGKYYIFSQEELGDILTQKELEDFCRWFGFSEEGNFEGKNIPNLIHNQDYHKADSYMEALCRRVYQYRLKRTALHRDDKILTSWNSIMIMAFSRAGFLLDRQPYAEQAQKAQMFVETHLTDTNDRLLVRYKDGESAFLGNLDDYAYYSLALLTLYETTLDTGYLEMALHRAAQMTELFWDDDNGGFYFYGTDAQELIERPKEIYDGAMPSGNSAAAHVLLKLAQLTAEDKWRRLADRQLSFLSEGAKDYPSAHCFSLMAFMQALGQKKELVCVSAENTVPKELRDYMREQAPSSLSVLFKCPGNANTLSRLAPFTKEYPLPDQGLCYYLCENHVCGLPLPSLSEVGQSRRNGA